LGWLREKEKQWVPGLSALQRRGIADQTLICCFFIADTFAVISLFRRCYLAVIGAVIPLFSEHRPQRKGPFFLCSVSAWRPSAKRSSPEQRPPNERITAQRT